MAVKLASGPVVASPEPAPPVRQFSFTDFQVNNATAPPPGDRLDAEFDRANGAISGTLNWASVSLNTDGSLRPGVVDQAQLVSGLFDDLAQGIADSVQVLVDEAQGYAGMSRVQAQAAAIHADSANLDAQGAAQQAETAQAAAALAVQVEAGTAANAATASVAALTAANASSNATGAEGKAVSYAVLAQAWAEHLPDTIPPNILAANDITGEHWSSRWWAHFARQTVVEAMDGLQALYDDLYGQLGDFLNKFYLGAFASAPGTGPFTLGVLYYDTTQGMMMVWDGEQWNRIVTAVMGVARDFTYLATQGQTVFEGADYAGNVLAFRPDKDTIQVWRNGLRLSMGVDFSVSPDRLTLNAPTVAGDVVSMDVIAAATAANAQAAIPVDTRTWVFNGTNVEFPLLDNQGVQLSPYTAADLFVSLDGVWLQAEADYLTRDRQVIFAVAPIADAHVFAICGIPVGNEGI